MHRWFSGRILTCRMGGLGLIPSPCSFSVPFGSSDGSDGNESACQCRRGGFKSLGGEDPLEKEMATHSGIIACKIPWTEEPGRLYSMGSHRVGHD